MPRNNRKESSDITEFSVLRAMFAARDIYKLEVFPLGTILHFTEGLLGRVSDIWILH